MTDAATADFVHLHVHTQFSLLDGAIRLDHLMERAKSFDMPAVAITDHGTMFGVLEFYQKARKAGLHPVVGCECYLAPTRLTDKNPATAKSTRHLVLLAENQTGYRNLCQLATIAQLKGFYYKPRIDKEVLREYAEGLIALSACLHGELARYILANAPDKADEAAREYQRIFGEDRFFLEVQHNGIDDQIKVNEALIDMGQRLSIPVVASNDCHYLDRGDDRAHEVLLCIQTGRTVHDPNRFKFSTDQLYFKSPQEMAEAFGHRPDILANSLAIARRCRLEFDLSTYHFPKFEDPQNRSADVIFEEQVREGFERVFARIRARNPAADEQVYRKRLDYEIKTIIDMGFPGYFLIVADFIRFGKTNGIPVGPGRGSAAGSIVAYAMGITDLDPIEHGLIFERFLNPSRISMPDIDVDFCINGRERVFKYVVERYGGGDYVAQIITFGKLKTRAVIRDVGRALDIPLAEVDAIAKLVPDVLNISLDQALKDEPELARLAKEKPEVGELIRIARTLEGLPRHASTHAAGVVIGDRPLVEYMPLYQGKKGEVVTQFDMKYVEKIGLVKFDFLGLRNLTVIDHALKLIRGQGLSVPDVDNLDFNDAATYALLGTGDTTGVFQLESAGMKDLLIRLKPASFADITALVALYRPGPMGSGMVEDFVDRKHGRRTVAYILPELEPILKETYGVILYQEQVMQIAGSLASYSMAEADDLRKAMGKKIAEKMADHRERFLKGAADNRLDVKKAETIFDLMAKFAGYGFNKSHSAAYALIAYQTAYLKAHYPVAFLAALLTSEMNTIDGVVKFIAECRSHKIPVDPPNINASDLTFTVDGDRIVFGMAAVKNVGEGAILAILDARVDGPFEDLFDFCERVDLRKVNKRVIESLIKCGAFDSTGAPRACLVAALEEAIEFGQLVQKRQHDPQLELFGGGSAQAPLNRPSLPTLTEWDERQRLAFEKEALGFYVSGHPMDRWQDTLDRFASTTAADMDDLDDNAGVRVGGMITGMRTLRTKKGDLMAFVQIEDLTGPMEILVFPRTYAAASDLLVPDAQLLIQGKLQKEENSAKIIADDIIPIEAAEARWTAQVHVTVDMDRTDRDQLQRLLGTLQTHRGDSAAFLHLQARGQAEVVIALPESCRLHPGATLQRDITGLLGYPAMETVCHPVAVPDPAPTDRYRNARSK